MSDKRATGSPARLRTGRRCSTAAPLGSNQPAGREGRDGRDGRDDARRLLASIKRPLHCEGEDHHHQHHGRQSEPAHRKVGSAWQLDHQAGKYLWLGVWHLRTADGATHQLPLHISSAAGTVGTGSLPASRPKMYRFQPTSRPALPTRQAPARRRQSVRRPRPVGPADHAVQIPPGCRRSAEPDPTPFRKRLRSLVNRRAQDPTGRRRARRRHRRAPLRRGQFYLTTAARPGRSSRRSAPPPGRSSRPGRKQASRPASAAGRSADVPNAACLRARPSRRTLAGAIGAWGCRGLPAAVVPAAAAQLGRPGRARII